MQIFFQRSQCFILIKLFFQKVLNSFDIVICCSFDLFYSLAVFHGEIGEDRVDERQLAVNLSGILANYLFFEKDFEPLKFDEDSVLLESVFAEVWSEDVNFGRISTINRRDSCQVGDIRYTPSCLPKENFG